MATRLYDFKCSNGHITEHFVDSETRTVKCPECDQDAKRVISKCSFVLDPVSGDYPGATMKWAREHSKAAKK
jgi:Zn finger protein HypA/HybF involved in hydrogenase expression